MSSDDPDAPADSLEPHGAADRNGPVWRVRVLLRWARRALTQRLAAEQAREVRRAVEEEGRFSERFALLCALSAGIATLGLLQSSPAVVIGAMLVSPLMGPIAALGFGFASFDGKRIQRASQVVAVGALIGIGVGMAITGLSPVRNATPEIIARTAPTLLDLAVALLSGLAGGYATVHRKGETAIGVAIATALMPPLATVGYSLAVLRFDFAAGAVLLFLTNLAAIAFSFALVARQRGVARPLAHVEFKPLHVALGMIAFLILATPLGLTLHRIAREAYAAVALRQELATFFGGETSQVAQIAVSWRNLGPPEIDATVITRTFRDDAETVVGARLARTLRAEPQLTISQIVAADMRAQTQAMIDAALRDQAAIAAYSTPPPPPIQRVREASIIPIGAAWADTEAKSIYLDAAALEGLTLSDYRREELRLDAAFPDWRIQVIPPFRERLFIPFESGSAAPNDASRAALNQALWALERWNVRHVDLEGLAGRRTDATRTTRELAQARAAAITELLADSALEIGQSVASRATSEQLFAAGGDARTTGVDIRVRPALLARRTPATSE